MQLKQFCSCCIQFIVYLIHLDVFSNIWGRTLDGMKTQSIFSKTQNTIKNQSMELGLVVDDHSCIGIWCNFTEPTESIQIKEYSIYFHLTQFAIIIHVVFISVCFSYASFRSVCCQRNFIAKLYVLYVVSYSQMRLRLNLKDFSICFQFKHQRNQSTLIPLSV